MSASFDVVVIGAGLIGAAAACQLSEHYSVALVEQESQTGYHSSGRSAAVLLPAYGGPLARALTAASREFLENPTPGFAPFPLTSKRGAIFIANERQLTLLNQWQPAEQDAMQVLSAAQVVQHVPILNSAAIAAAVWVPEVKDIDAAALLSGYLKMFRARGGRLLLSSKVRRIARDAGHWRLSLASGEVLGTTIVNAGGAWADEIAELAGGARKGLVPTRRTMVMVDGPSDTDVRAWPLVADVAETFYFKPDGGRLVVSPADCSVVSPHDVQPDEWDIAVAIERLEAATSLQVRRVTHRWAGLRTFAPDDEPLIGFDPDLPNFIWAAGFGGYGVQAAHATGRCCHSLLGGEPLPEHIAAAGVDLDRLSPRRLAQSREAT
ncbi:MAG TPA: FAD-binding oxidoreductase [Steroidobacter sp.]